MHRRRADEGADCRVVLQLRLYRRKVLNAFACRLKIKRRLRGGGGILCDERYVSKRTGAVCIARAKELLFRRQ